MRAVYKTLKITEDYMAYEYEYIGHVLPDQIVFVTAQELEDRYPALTPREREYKAAREYGAIFIEQIGKKLASGKPHDGRAPDYDDWELNGDIIVYYPVLDIALELSSMGIRVDEDSLRRQLAEAGCEERAELAFQKALLNGELPYTIGGGIGQSRICMFFLRKAHIGEIQASIWACGCNGSGWKGRDPAFIKKEINMEGKQKKWQMTSETASRPYGAARDGCILYPVIGFPRLRIRGSIF